MDAKLENTLVIVTKMSLDKASQVFSKMIKTGARIDADKIYVADISEATEKVTADDREVVAAMVDLKGDMHAKFLFMVNTNDTLVLTDKILRRAVGTTKEFDIYASSAVQELGNVMASAISNVFSTNFEFSMFPTPPLVVNDFAGTIFQSYLMDIAMTEDKLIIVDSKFNIVNTNIYCSMFLLPIPKFKEFFYKTGEEPK